MLTYNQPQRNVHLGDTFFLPAHLYAPQSQQSDLYATVRLIVFLADDFGLNPWSDYKWVALVA